MSAALPVSSGRELGTRAQAAFLGLELIGRVCQGLAVARLQAPEVRNDWFEPVSRAVDKARQDARRWIDSLGPDLNGSVPSQVLGFAAHFETAIGAIRSHIERNPAALGAADPTVIEVAAQVNQLRTAIQVVIDQADGAATRLRDWGAKLQLSHDELAEQLGRVQAREIVVLGHIQDLNKAIVNLNGQLDAENQQASRKALWLGFDLLLGVLALAMTPLTMGLSLLVGVPALLAAANNIYEWAFINERINGQLKAITDKREKLDIEQRQMVALQTLAQATTQLRDGMDTALQALVDLRTCWEVLDGELKGVSEQLARAEDSVSTILQGIFAAAASQEWQVAVTLAGQMTGPAVQAPQQDSQAA